MAGETKVALLSFIISFVFTYLLCCLTYKYEYSLNINVLILCIYGVAIYMVLRYVYSTGNFQIAIRSAALSTIFCLGIYIRITASTSIKAFGCYMAVMAFFHYSEFLCISVIQDKQISIDSFMLQHSVQYVIAAVASWVEFFVESYFFPGCKQFLWISNIGLCVCIAGEILRKTAMLTAGSNFNHYVQWEKSCDHILITSGVYNWCRHPSYVGWFYWSIGTQIILLNPICLPCYILAGWLFFKERIYIEEITLLNFFGQKYCEYQSKVGTGIPFIIGYKI